MVRETRHLWVGNLPDNIREDRIREHFKRYGRVQSVKLLPRIAEEKAGEVAMACTVAFMDIKSASKAHNSELKIDDRTLNTEYYEPAAIPSAASPQNTPSPYSTSPGATRFPNGHGSSDEHGPFPDVVAAGAAPTRFYDRAPTSATPGGAGAAAPNPRPPPDAAGAPERRGGGGGVGVDNTSTAAAAAATADAAPLPGRGRTRDRHRTQSAGVGWSGYEATARYNNSSSLGNQSETGYNSTPAPVPSESIERRNSEQNAVARKKTNSRSGSRSPSPSGSASSRSLSRSRSRSSSSSSSSSTSRATSSTSSPRSRPHHHHHHGPSGAANAAGAQGAACPTTGDRRPLAICVKNLPLRSSDTSLKDGLFHEYKKHGKVTWVKVVGQGADRYALVCFKKTEDAEKALEVSYDKLFFGCKIEVEPYIVCEVDDYDLRPYEAEIDEYHPKATRTLFIGNLEKDVTASDLRKHFDQFGEIIEIDIKKQGAVSSYAFCQYSDIVSVVKAIRKMDGEHLGNNRIKLGFGKSMAYSCVWIDGVNEAVNEKYLRMQFEPFGAISRCVLDRDKGQALVFYEHVSQAQLAVGKMRGFVLKNSKLQVDFASRECQECFFERLEKQQGAALDRGAFEERRDSSSRSFESSAASRISRYDTPTRPRTSSYSSRSSVAAMQSPGTPGSMTPRGGRSRVSRYDYYDIEYGIPGERHVSHRSYDEYSQGSAASHEDPYDPHDYGPYSLHDSPGHLDPLEVRVVQNLVDAVPYPPLEIRNLQKERVHLLEQLEECPSSGDELISPKKRLKLDLLDGTSDVIIEANRDHRKVMEVRRLSDATLRHHSRRPSVDTKYKEHVSSSGHYSSHSVGCKRRKTAGDVSKSSISSHSHYVTVAEHSDGSEAAGSRPGTPLCDEKPEFPQGEPRRTPREREGPLTLPLPKFAAQIMTKGSVSVAGIKGQKDSVNILSSPPATSTSPRVTNRPPSPVHVPPPASPPPRPPSLSSNSSDSDATPPSPSLEERIRSLDEKYEKWSGSRAKSAAGGEALAILDANLEKFRQRHKLLDLDLKEVQPSEIVKSVMAKRSVFDEDLKRLECVGEKYEPNEFGLFGGRMTSLAGSSAPATPLSAPPTLKLAPAAQAPKTPTTLSPRSSGTNITTAKGLQYPFPSHPPMPMSPAPVPPPPTPAATPASPAPPPPAAATAARTTSHGENRLKSCASATGGEAQRTTGVGKVTVNAATCARNSIPEAAAAPGKTKSERVAGRRDSNSCSPRADVKTRRNSDAGARRLEESEKFSEPAKISEEQRLAEKIKEEQERLDKENQEKERIERERLEKEKQERDRLERERLEKKERQERESELEKQRLEKERLEKERLQKEKQEKERQERERTKRLEKERLEKEKQQKEREEKEEKERRELAEKERQEREAQDKLEKERKEAEERERQAKEEAERERLEKVEKERKKDDERSKHKEDNHHHDRRKDRENHSENKHRENNIHDKNTKESGKDEIHRHENSRHDKSKDTEKRKENRDNNLHERHKSLTETKEHRDRLLSETRHMSIDSDKNRANDNTKDPNKRKERNNSLPATLGNKRRMSSHESIDATEEKKIKLIHDHKERRDSKDSCKSEEKLKKSKHKNNSLNSHEKHNSSKESEEKRREKEREREERHKKHKLEKQKSKNKLREKESRDVPPSQNSVGDKDFLAKLNLRSNEELEQEKQKREHKERHEKRDEKKPYDGKKEKHQSSEDSKKLNEDRKNPKKERIRKPNTSDSDSDEPKKQHSIFDIVDDEPAYISMYDKVKARSCKNMQKQEEEKRQEKIKAKFSQLKLSRARREEKKRSTSWDEDSDTDKETEVKSRRSRKVLDSSDESQERKAHKRKEIYSDSDCSVFRQNKMELTETTDDEIKSKHSLFKGCKSRIASDTSDDEYQKTKLSNQIISEDFHDKKVNSDMSKLFSENDDQGFVDADEKPEKITSVKTELERLIKKERRSSKFQEIASMENQIYTESECAIADIKSEKFNSRKIFDNTSEDETDVIKKEKSEKKEKKHKKKQKKQKHFLLDETSIKSETEAPLGEHQEKIKHHEKKKDHSKKDKKRDKTKEGRDKTKKSKKNKSDSKGDVKTDGKMETIFGSFSEDSENGVIEQRVEQMNFLTDENAQQPSGYNTDSDKEQDTKTKEERDREEHKRRKEKKRREKERRLQEAAAEAAAAANSEPPPSNENSMDFIDMGKRLEENIKDDTPEIEVKSEFENSNLETGDSFCFGDKSDDLKKEDRREGKEKKKKRKKSKEERSKHHHHHHHEKKTKSPEIKKEEVKEESIESKCQNQSLPTILEMNSPTAEKPSPEFVISPSTRETAPIISPIPKTPTTFKEKKREKLIPGFGTEIDETIHENAVKSISTEFDSVVKKEEPAIKEELKEEKAEEQVEDKPRVVISQEETEDAVAALLGESFGGDKFNNCYTEEITTTTEEAEPAEENNAQDDEEMRQAVQSLSSTDLDVKPETPQSEHELQIDTDTEEQEETSVSDQQPKSPQVPKSTPDVQVFQSGTNKKPPSPPVRFMALPKICSLPSLTPIISQPSNVTEANKKDVEEVKPVIPEQKCSVISQTWPSDRKQEVLIPEPKAQVISQISSSTPPLLKAFSAPSTLKVNEVKANYPPLTAITKPSPQEQQKPQVMAVKPVVPQMHNLPPRSPLQICKPLGQDGVQSPRSSVSLNLNRLPITPVVVSKALQTTTVILPQPKIAHPMEPPKLVSASDPKSQERPRMVFQTSTVPYPAFASTQAPRMIVQGNIRHLPPAGLLVPTRHIAPPNYAYMGNIPHSTYNNMPISKECHPTMVDNKLTQPHSAGGYVTTKSTIIMSSAVNPQIPNNLRPPIHHSQLILTCPKQNLPSPAVSPRSGFIPGQPSPTVSSTAVLVSTTAQLTTSAPSNPVTVASSQPMNLATSTQPVSQNPKPVSVITEPSSSTAETSIIQAPVKPETPSKDQLSIPVSENSRTSTPSPVIVPNPMPEVKTDTPPVETKLAIEQVTEELNVSLKKEVDVKETKEEPIVEKPTLVVAAIDKKDQEEAPKEEPKSSEEKAPVKEESQIEHVSTDDVKEEENVLSKEDPLDTKEDSDYWAKEVNIESVIKTLCSADEMSDHDNSKDKETEEESNKQVEGNTPKKEVEEEESTEGNEEMTTDTEEVKSGTTSTRGGARGRGRGGRRGKPKPVAERGGIQTRRGKLKELSTAALVVSKRGGRGGRTRSERNSCKSESDNTDVYEFKDEPDDSSKEQRPRLVLTIKSTTSSTSNSQATAIVKEITKDGAKEIGKEIKEAPEKETQANKQPEAKEAFTSPQSNTRKSRRLAEKDISRNTVDDTIEDVVKNTPQTRASSNQRRSSRQAATKSQASPVVQQPETPRKSPRGRKPRRASEATENSSSEEIVKDTIEQPAPKSPVIKDKVLEKPSEVEKEVISSNAADQTKEKPFEGLKAAMLRRIKGELTNAKLEPTNLIDPVTGLLIPMRESEEGKYIPLPGSNKTIAAPVHAEPLQAKPSEPTSKAPTNTAQVLTVVQQQMPKVHPLKAHVLSSQANKAVLTHHEPKPTPSVVQMQQPMVISKPITPIVQSKASIPMNQNINIATSGSGATIGPLSPRPGLPVGQVKPQVKPPMLSPSQQILLSNQQKQYMQQVSKQQSQLQIPKSHATSAIPQQQAQIVNAQMAHLKHQPMKQQVIITKGPMTKPPHALHQPILTGQVASPPLSKSQTAGARIIQVPPSAATKGVMEPPKVDVNLSNVILGRPNLSPQGPQARLAGLPVPGYEASLGEPIAHFPGPLRPPPDLSPAHYMHPTHVMYQQYLRQQQLQQQHLQRSGALDKSGEEGEEAPVGLTLSGRGAAVPHSLHSPHDRATESPQMGQVYNTLPHTARLTPYHPSNRYFDQAEPPPAHRPLTSHGSLAALPGDRGLAHMGPLGTPDRPLSGHLQPDRPLGAHSMPSAHMGGMSATERMSAHIERPHGVMGAGLGAAGNLMGAVAKHIGADAPATQRGVQAATPPHASQVPPQAESLFMLLKQYPLMWQGLLALKNDQAAVQMYFVSGNDEVAKSSLPKNTDGSTPPLRIFQRMRLEPPQVEGVARKMQMENEHCMLLALPCGHDHMDVLKQSTNLTSGFITYLQQKQAAGIVNVPAPGTTQPAAYVVHIFPSCDFVNENLRRIAPSLLERVADIAHLLIVITTV